MTLNDLERPKRTLQLPARGAEKMRLLEPTAQICLKIDPYMQRQKCRRMTLVSGNIRHMRILAAVPLGGASNESGVVYGGNFWRFEWLLLRKLQR